jgi:transcriptional regulator with XRE-family HTH domain
MRRFGEKLRALRKRHGTTQKQLSKQTGLAQSYVSELEAGRKNPGADLAVKIADFFGVPIDVLVRDELDLDAEDEP